MSLFDVSSGLAPASARSARSSKTATAPSLSDREGGTWTPRERAMASRRRQYSVSLRPYLTKGKQVSFAQCHQGMRNRILCRT